MLTKAEAKLKFLLLIDIYSEGVCTKSDQELATLAETTVPYVQTILKQMVSQREIYMGSSETGRKITYPKKQTGKLW